MKSIRMEKENKEPQKNFKDLVLAKIKSGRTKMRPKWHFILKAFLALAGIFIVALALLYSASFIFFILIQTGVWFVPVFGILGIRLFLFSLPWLLIFASIIFIILLEILVKHYSFAYRKPLFYSIIVIVIAVFTGSAALSFMRFHQGFSDFAQRQSLPLAAPLYKEYGMKHFRNVHPATIIKTDQDLFLVKSRRGEELIVIITPQTRFPLGIDFKEGDEIVVMGELKNGSIEAFGIRRVGGMMNNTHPRMNSDRHRMFWPRQ